MKNKKGFTLSEVMIAVGIVGVLAAMLVPAIVNNAPDNNKVMFKKAYSILENSVADLINDEANYPEGTTNWNGSTCQVSGTAVDCGFANPSYTPGLIPAGSDKFCYLLADKLNTVGSVKCEISQFSGILASPNFTTTDGIKWWFQNSFDSGATVYSIRIDMDVNGDKKPNCMAAGTYWASRNGNACTAGINPDIHEIEIRYDGKLQIDSHDTTAIDILSNPTDNKKD